MPPATQRRNTAYLNRPISRTGQLDRELEDQAPRPQTGLAIDLGDSIDPHFRPDDPGRCLLGPAAERDCAA
jgi:hypothetical protein